MFQMQRLGAEIGQRFEDAAFCATGGTGDDPER
jgi:hypothetical protein